MRKLADAGRTFLSYVCFVKLPALINHARIQDTPDRLPSIKALKAIADRANDSAVPVPKELPSRTNRITQNRHAETPVYPLLETNIDTAVMEFSQEKIPKIRSKLSIGKHGSDTPFVHHSVV